jgi:hypothetical protein
VVQLQSVGLQSRPTGDRVASHLAGSAPEVEKERVVGDANLYHHVAPNHLQANILAAAAAGLSKVGPILEWNNIAANEVRLGHAPVQEHAVANTAHNCGAASNVSCSLLCPQCLM